jgi:hypothetical protein
MPADFTPFGPGTLILGEIGTEIDISCQIESARIEWEEDTDDDVTTLCGDVVPGATTYSANLTGTLFLDLNDATGALFTSWSQKGQPISFTFVPNTAAGVTAEGTLIWSPLPFGGDEPKANMTADFTWRCVGEPTLTAGGALFAAAGADFGDGE